jgi:hypothetical protein
MQRLVGIAGFVGIAGQAFSCQPGQSAEFVEKRFGFAQVTEACPREAGER